MAPAVNSRKRSKALSTKTSSLSLDSLVKLAQTILFKPTYLPVITTVLLVIELVINFSIIYYVKYTEIDWSTYMQQVECFLNGTMDYENISGNTGPIVYPAGHLYVYTGLYYLTSGGTNLKLAQTIFALLYVANLFVVHLIYRQNKSIPPYVLMLISFTSYRVHSLFVLRLFNDAVAMFFLYVAVYLFTRHLWSLGCVSFSIAVSIKMNVLLFAPALFLILVENHEKLFDVIKNLFVCAFVQLILAAPFLATYPVSYLRCAFNLGRVFMHKWTVNWRFLPEDVFVSKDFHLLLLGLHILILLAVFGSRWMALVPRLFQQSLGKSLERVGGNSNSLLVTLFTVNLIGIAFSRSLHYQFYLWYYHAIPFLLWNTEYRVTTKLCMWGLIELVWKIYPSTFWSSALLHTIHLALIGGLWHNRRANGIVLAHNKIE